MPQGTGAVFLGELKGGPGRRRGGDGEGPRGSQSDFPKYRLPGAQGRDDGFKAFDNRGRRGQGLQQDLEMAAAG